MWECYLLICSDGTLYCGVTNDFAKRLKAHNGKNGAKYTKTRQPVKLYKKFSCPNKKIAVRLEYRIKQLPRKEKLLLTNEIIEKMIQSLI
jgi:putative endonuclease